MADGTGRSLFVEYVDYLKAAEEGGTTPVNFGLWCERAARETQGRGTTVIAGTEETAEYVIEQAWCTHLESLRTERAGWPKSFVLGSGQSRTRHNRTRPSSLRRAGRTGGGLDVARAVFLPVEARRRRTDAPRASSR